MRRHISIRRRVRPSVRPSVRRSVPCYFRRHTRRILCRLFGLVFLCSHLLTHLSFHFLSNMFSSIVLLFSLPLHPPLFHPHYFRFPPQRSFDGKSGSIWFWTRRKTSRISNLSGGNVSLISAPRGASFSPALRCKIGDRWLNSPLVSLRDDDEDE